jgi:transposase
MPKPYLADLRERVLLAGEAGLPPAVIAQRFGVGLSTVYLWRQQARAEGRRCAKPHAGGRTLGIDAAGEAILRALVSERNDRTLDEYREQLAARSGRARVSRPTLCRALRRFGLWRKKDAARQRAGPRRHPRGTGGLLRADPAARPQGAGLHRRDRHHHSDDPPLRPGAARRPGTGLSPMWPLAAADRPGRALRRGNGGGHEH